MAKQSSQEDLLTILANFIAHRKGLPVLLGVGLALFGLVLNCFPTLAEVGGFWGWVIEHHLFLYLGVIIGFLGILVGDAL